MKALLSLALLFTSLTPVLAQDAETQVLETPNGQSYLYYQIPRKRDGWKTAIISPSDWLFEDHNPWAHIVGSSLLVASGYGDVSSAEKQAAFEKWKSNAAIGDFSEYRTYELYAQKRELDEFFPLILENFKDPKLDPEIFENLKKHIYDQIVTFQDQSGYQASQLLGYSIFRDSGYFVNDWDMTPALIQSLTIEEVQSWVDDAKSAPALYIGIAGAENSDELANYIDDFKTTLNETSDKIEFRKSIIQSTGKTIVLIRDGIDKAQFLMEAPYNYDSQTGYNSLEFANSVLSSSGEKSRLWKIREEMRASYGIGSAIEFLGYYQSGLVINGETPIEDQGEVLKKIREINHDFVENPITEDEYNTAKEVISKENDDALKDENYLAITLALDAAAPYETDSVKLFKNMDVLDYQTISDLIKQNYPKESDWTTIIVTASQEGLEDADCIIHQVEEIEGCFAN